MHHIARGPKAAMLRAGGRGGGTRQQAVEAALI